MKIKHLNFPKISDTRGNLTFIQFPNHVPFEIQRVFWTYNVPGGKIRGGHAYKTQEEIIIAINGSFDVIIKKTNGQLQRIHLNRCYEGLHLAPKTWRHLENYSTNAVSLHLSNCLFDPKDYINNYEEFIKY